MTTKKSDTNLNYYNEWSGIWLKNSEKISEESKDNIESNIASVHDSEERESNHIWIDIRSICCKKSKTEMLDMIKEELYDLSWDSYEVTKLGQTLKRFKISSEDEDDQNSWWNPIENQNSYERDSLVHRSLCQRTKGQRLSYEEKVYVYSKLNENKVNQNQLMQFFNISHTTLK